MKNTLLAVICFLSYQASSQTLFITRTGQISFYSKTPMENIDGVNNEATSMLNPQSGELVFAVLIKSFRFEKALMEEHFNENYMESSKLPKATFSGKIANLSDIDFKKSGKYNVKVEGELTIHGVKKNVSTTGILEVAGDKILANSTFNVKPADYDIEIPSLVADKIAETIEVKINCQYEPKK
jgi:polyisoprenoid-binding protein YceI